MDAPNPHLAWSLSSDVRGTVSTGYQLQLQRVSDLATAPGSSPAWNTSAAPFWDTSQVPHCHGVPAGVLCVPESHTLYSGPPLAAATAYQWRTRWWSNATSDAASSGYSKPAMFVTGLYAPTDWQDAAFLTCANSTEPPPPPPPPPAPGSPEWPIVGPPQCRHLRTDFSLSHLPVRATAYLAAMGYAELWINGQKAVISTRSWIFFGECNKMLKSPF